MTNSPKHVHKYYIDIRKLPLTALRAFALIAETGSANRAADELRVTHSAVSRSLASLESQLGQRLFVRRGRKFEITPAGSLLASRISAALNLRTIGCDEVSGSSMHPSILIKAPTTFAMYWLLPRIRRYEQEVGNIEINVITYMTNDAPGFSGSDILITRGPFDNQPYRFPVSQILLEEEITVIVSSNFERLSKLINPADITKHTVISAATRPDDWPRWLTQFASAPHKYNIRHRFDHLFVAMHAVSAGLGTIVAPINIFQDYENPAFIASFKDMTYTGLPYILHLCSATKPTYIIRFIE